MTFEQTMSELESLGTESNRKTYLRHGATANLFGVSFAHLEKLRKRIKRDHLLAVALWRTGNVDARNLATMIADPAAMTSRDFEEWAKGIEMYGHAGLLARHVASKSAIAEEKTESWIKSKHEYVGNLGWDMVAMLAMSKKALPDAYFEEKLAIIEAGIGKAKNRVRHAMVMALISIGMRNPGLERRALALSKRIGKVEVDHGDTNCVTPDPAAYIARANKRKRYPC